jgi:methylase of polypeptide subunit release factors
MRNEEGNSRHRAILQKLGFGQWSEYNLPAINQAFVERSPRHLKDATYNIARLSIACHSGLYHPDVNSSSVFILHHLLDKALFSNQPENILEIGTGCGVIILALQQFLNTGTYTGVDIDPASIACAKSNAARNDINIRFIQSDLFSSIPGERYDIIIFNFPLYAGAVEGKLAPELIGKLYDYRGQLLERFIAELPAHLTKNGYAYLTISNTGHLAALDRPDLDINVIAFERFFNGFLRILIQLRPAELVGCRENVSNAASNFD